MNDAELTGFLALMRTDLASMKTDLVWIKRVIGILVLAVFGLEII